MNNSPLLNFTKVASTTHIRVLEQKAVRVRKGGNSLVLTRYLRSTSCLIVFLSLLCYYILCKSRQTSSTPMAAGKWITDIIFSATALYYNMYYNGKLCLYGCFGNCFQWQMLLKTRLKSSLFETAQNMTWRCDLKSLISILWSLHVSIILVQADIY